MWDPSIPIAQLNVHREQHPSIPLLRDALARWDRAPVRWEEGLCAGEGLQTCTGRLHRRVGPEVDVSKKGAEHLCISV